MSAPFARPERAPAARPASSVRILFAGELWEGSDAYAYIRAMRRAHHAVTAISADGYIGSGWRSAPLRVLRRALMPVFVREYEQALVHLAEQTRPELFVGFKAPFVTRRAMRAIQNTGAVTINIYPDVSFTAHGKYLPTTLPLYDWVFTTKTFGLADMAAQLGILAASFFPPAFDPEVHYPRPLSRADEERLGADVSFIGSWSPNKERLVSAVARALPDVRLRVWGNGWNRRLEPVLAPFVMNLPIIGADYAKAVCASAVNLGLVSELVTGASSGDLITHRTIAMPACGGFMLHERTSEVTTLFEEDRECALFGSEEELVAKVRYFLDNSGERLAIAAAGHRRALASGYSVDDRAREVVARYRKLRALRGRGRPGPAER